METKHTINNPLKLRWDGIDYRVNKPNQGTQDLVSKEVATELLEALIRIREAKGVILFEEFAKSIAKNAIKKATE